MKRITTLLLLAASTCAVAQPSISSVSPESGHPGATVTITGTGFNATAANDIVYFGATRATVTSASSTSLTVQVPSGATYMPVSVNNTATSLTGYSEHLFLPTYDHSAYPAGATAFVPKVDFAMTTPSDPIQVLIQDMDGDGKADLVVMTFVDVSIYRNTSTTGSINSGSFASPVSYPLPGPYVMGGWMIGDLMAIGDVDGDGVPDLLFGRTYTDSIYVMRNTSTPGSFGFSSLVPFATGGAVSYGINCIAMADMDGDGKADAVINNGDGSVSVLLNTSTAGAITTSSFAAPFNVMATASYGLYGLAVGDIDGDGKLDIAVTGIDSTISVFRNTSTLGSISLGSQVTYGSGLAANTQTLIMSDIDGDGKLDLAVTNGINNTISIFRNTATAGVIDASSFGAPVIFASAFQAGSIVAGDFDGDGKPDLAVSATTEYWGPGDYNLDQAIYLYHNNATPGTINQGSFSAIAYPLGHNNLFGIAVGDIDGDGKPDIVTANNDDSTISILRNAPLSPDTIIAVSPGNAYPGDVVTITGSNFSTTASDNIVFFGATKATVIAASSSALSVTVSVGATYDAVTVGNTATKRTAYSKSPFLPTFDGSGIVPGPILFDTAVNFADPSGSTSSAVVIADFDGDGKADVAALTSTGFAIYRNTASAGSVTGSSFASAIDFAVTGASWSCIAAGDINGDGKPDLVISSFIPGIDGLMVYRNTSTSGAVTFGAPVFYPEEGRGTSIKIQDMNGDGKPDVVIGTDVIWTDILLNTSNGNIDSSTLTRDCNFFPMTTGGAFGVVTLAVADLDGDGLPDAVESTGDTILVFRNVLTGFAPPITLYAGPESWGLTLADVDGDGKLDIAAVSVTNSTLSIFRNTASTGFIDSTSFASPVAFATGLNPRSVAAGDLNGDGKLDLVVLNQGEASVSIFRNTATPGVINSSSMVANIDSPAGNYPMFVAVGDIDGDGKADIVTACLGIAPGTAPGGIAVLTNKVSAPTTTATKVPAAGIAEMRILPNPNKGVFSVSGVTGTGGDEVLTLQVTDLVGQVIYTSKSIATNGVINEKVVLNNALANGMYLLNVTTATGNNVFHFVVEK